MPEKPQITGTKDGKVLIQWPLREVSVMVATDNPFRLKVWAKMIATGPDTIESALSALDALVDEDTPAEILQLRGIFSELKKGLRI